MSYWFVPPEWQGETVAILGCGTSLGQLTSWELESLKYVRTIAINDAFLLAPWADVLYFGDSKWWHLYRELVGINFCGRRIITLENLIPGVKTLRNAGATGLSTDPGAICNGSNSGYAAINLAYLFGARQILLLGYDMQLSPKGQVHWRGRPGPEVSPEGQLRVMQNVMLPKFSSLVEPLRAEGVEVVNCTPDSALKVWPAGSIQNFLVAPVSV